MTIGSLLNLIYISTARHKLGKVVASWRTSIVALTALLASATAAQAIDLTVVPTLSPSTLEVTEISTLRIEIQSTDTSPVTGVGFNLSLPAGMAFRFTGANITTDCAGGVVSTTGSTDFSLSGATIPAATIAGPGSCHVELLVQANTVGTYVFNIAANAVGNTLPFPDDATNPNASSVSLTTLGEPLTVRKAIAVVLVLLGVVLLATGSSSPATGQPIAAIPDR